jgi:predicted LPLAT superfamily acyltransferase
MNCGHWSAQKELSSSYFRLKLTLCLFKIFPAFVVKLLCFPVSLFYWAASGRARNFSRCFLNRVFYGTGKKPNPLKHILSFSLAFTEKLEAWAGKMKFDGINFPEHGFRKNDIGGLIESLEQKQGAVLICSHLGNAEMLRALANFNQTGLSRNIPVISIVDFSVTAYFNRMLKELTPDSTKQVISAENVGADTVIMLSERIASGGLLVIAGDRTSATTKDNLSIKFFGKDADFPFGVFLLAALLEAPVYFVFSLRNRDITLFPKYEMYVHRSSVDFACPRKERASRIFECASEYAAMLENYCRAHPYQWYNFYDFWQENPEKNGVKNG